MPESEWTPAETARGVKRALETLDRIEDKLESRPTRDEWQRAEVVQLRKDTEQDVAIQTLESNYTKLLFAALGGALTGLSGLVTALVTR
jgi:hypothetical protein